MLIEMAFNLPLRLHDEAEARPVTRRSRYRADNEGPAVPQWIQQARPRIELLEPRLAPSQMIGLFASGFEQHVARRSGARDECLAVIERLGRYFAGMVHPHESRRFSTISFGERRWRLGGVRFNGRRGIRYRTRSVSGGEDRSQCPIGGRDEGV